MRNGRHLRACAALLLLVVVEAQAQPAPNTFQDRERRLSQIGRTASELEIDSQHQDFDEATQTLIFEGDVDVRQKDVFELSADRVIYYRQSGWIQAEGAVQFNSGPDQLTGDWVTYNTKTGRARIHNTHAVFYPSLVVEAEVVEKLEPHPKTGADRFWVEKGVFTSCHRPGTGWHLRAKQAMIHMDNYVHLWNVSFRAGGVPLFYLPYYVQSIKPKRTTGFLPPRLGTDSAYGPFLDLEFFWAMFQWLDWSIVTRPYPAGRLDVSSSLRFKLHKDDPINVIEGRHQRVFESGLHNQLPRTIYALTALLNHKFPWKVVGTGNINLVTDAPLFDAEADPRLRAQTFSRADIGVSRAFGSQSVRVLASTFSIIQGNANLVQKLPSVAYSSGAPWKLIGNALKLKIEAVFDGIRREQEFGLSTNRVSVERQYFRAHVVPTLSSTIALPGVSIEPNFSLVETYWSQRREVDPNLPSDTFATFRQAPVLGESEIGASIGHAGDGLYRHLYRAVVNVKGPAFYRLFSADEEKEGKLKHLIQPEFRYQFLPFVDEQEVIDSGEVNIDRIFAQRTGFNPQTGHHVSYSLSNILLYKSKGQPNPIEVFRFTVGNSYRFLREREKVVFPGQLAPTPLGDLTFSLQARPTARSNGRIDVFVEPEDWHVRQVRGNVQLDSRRFALLADYTYYQAFGRARVDDEIGWNTFAHTVGATTRVRLTDRWEVRARGMYNVLDGLVADSFLEVGYAAQCWGVSVSGGLIERLLIPNSPDPEKERNFSIGFSVHLLNLGSLGSSTGLP